MSRHDSHYSPFAIEGRFLGFAACSEGKLKYFSLATAAGEVELKLAKPLRGTVGPQLIPGTWITVRGEQKLKKSGEIKRKVWDIQISTASPAVASGESPGAQATAREPKPHLGCIQICHKSDCCKRGGRQVLQALEQAVSQHPEGERIQIKPMGCIKNCKAGPNLVIMPGRARYSRVRPETAAELIQHHFPCPAVTS